MNCRRIREPQSIIYCQAEGVWADLVHEGVIRLKVPDALLSEIARSMTLSFVVMFSYGLKKREKRLQPFENLNGRCKGLNFDDTHRHLHLNALSIVEVFKLKKERVSQCTNWETQGTTISKIYWNLCFLATLALKLDGCRREVALKMTLISYGNGVGIVRFSSWW